jgi:hypothetical protein
MVGLSSSAQLSCFGATFWLAAATRDWDGGRLPSEPLLLGKRAIWMRGEISGSPRRDLN